jgi:hypothetical protein
VQPTCATWTKGRKGGPIKIAVQGRSWLPSALTLLLSEVLKISELEKNSRPMKTVKLEETFELEKIICGTNLIWS